MGRQYAGARCDVHVDGEMLRFWIGDQLVKPPPAPAAPGYKIIFPYAPATRHNTECQGSTETETLRINRLWNSLTFIAYF